MSCSRPMQRTAASRWGARGSYRGKSWRWSCGLHRRALSSAPPRRGSAELQRADADRAQATTGTRCAGKRLPPRSQLRCSAHSLPRFPLCGPSLPTSNRPRPISFLPPSPPNRGHLSASTPSPSGLDPVYKSSLRRVSTDTDTDTHTAGLSLGDTHSHTHMRAFRHERGLWASRDAQELHIYYYQSGSPRWRARAASVNTTPCRTLRCALLTRHAIAGS